jgi:DNA-binding HxlR family transcriptional regulator
MKKDSYRICLHSVEEIATTISKKWAIFILILLGHHGRLRFSELTFTLEGISPKSLADMLKELHEEGLIQREAFSEIPLGLNIF